MATEDVLDAVLRLDVDLLVVSGGEPLNQQRQLVPLLRALRDRQITVEVETNGTQRPLPELVELVRRFVVSPKLAHSGDPARRRLVRDALMAFQDSGKADFKFVARSAVDLHEVAEVVDNHGLTRIWIMPEGKTSDEVRTTLREIADATVLRRWNLTGRLHVFAWGDARAV
jgi:7-carboxy-7-deazaguanine synthase